jgi:hypothetical protein
MKLKPLIEQASNKFIPKVFVKLFNKFPRDTKTWSNATDEMPDIAKMARLHLEDIDGIKMPSLNLSSADTPALWNSMAQSYIVTIYNKMSTESKQMFIQDLKNQYGNLFK